MKTRNTLIAAAGALLLAGMLAPHTGLAQKKPGGGGGGGGGNPTFQVRVVQGNFYPDAPSYLPYCERSASASKNGWAYVPQPRHDPCGAALLSDGYLLGDDVILGVRTDKQGRIVAVRLRGQDVIGEEGIMHESEWMSVLPVTPVSTGFTVHVHADNVAVWKLSGHLSGDRVAIVAYVSIGDVVYIPE
jgi:hypothetical protein